MPLKIANPSNMALSDQEAKRQIQQMVSFILNEAKEKAQEIEAKALQDFNIEKLKIVQTMKEKVRSEYVKKMQKIEMDRAIAKSAAINDSRLKKIKARDQVFNDVIKHCKSRLTKLTANTEQYKTICLNLIVQGCLRLMESDVIVKCREMDKALIATLLPEAQKKYSTIVQKELGMKKFVKLSIDNSVLPPPSSSTNLGSSCAGGVVLMPADHSITCNNTLDQRLDLVIEQCKPQIRPILFD